MLLRPHSARMTGKRSRSPRFTGLIALAACTLPLPAAASAQSTQASAELDVPAYEVELGRIAESLKDTEQIPQLRKSLPRAWTVRVGDRSVQVRTGWLASDLKKIEQDTAKSPSISQEV